MNPDSPTIQIVRNLAAKRGLRTLHFAQIDALSKSSALEDWLESGFHGELEWMELGREVRRDPRIRFPEARCAAVFSVFHHHQRPPKPHDNPDLIR